MTFTYPLALLGLLTLPYFLWLGKPAGVWARARSWIALVLRALIIVLLVLALAGLQIVSTSDRLAVVFLIDASDSVPPQSVEAARQYAADAIAQMKVDDQAAIIVFGSNALVERPMSGSREVGPIESKVIPLNTDLSEAIRLGMALYPPGAARRMVILSDGLANTGDAESAARLAAASGVQIVAVPSDMEQGAEILITTVDVPTRMNEGQTFDMTVTVESTVQTNALLRVMAGGQVLVEQGVALTPGINRYSFTLTATETGLTSFRVQIIPENGTGTDVFYQNNELSAFTQVVGPPRVLIVADNDFEIGNLADALLSQGLLVDRTEGVTMPSDLATLSSYQSIMLVNVPARNLGPRKMRVIQSYVRDLGGGLVVIGGPHAYAVGGYFQTPLEETLPVEMRLKDQERLPRMTVVYTIDRSGSMSDTSVGGFQKIELAKEAIIRSVNLLNPFDKVGVVAFDENASWVVPISQLDDPGGVAMRVGTLRAGGGTDIYAGVLAVSKVLPQDDSQLRHIILLTDGGASETGVPELVQKMYEEEGITCSVIAIGAGYAPWIEELPKIADGRFHYAYDVDTIPEIFSEETVIATKSYIIEHEFYPDLTGTSPILNGISSTPSLLGYVGATVKPTAQQILMTDEKDPLLASWQYGLGRSVAWTSDATGRWAINWAGWPDYARFWSQAVRWTITEGVNQNVEVRVIQGDETAHIIVDAQDDDGTYLNDLEMSASVVGPDLKSNPLALQQVAPGRYEGTFMPGEEGAYFVRVAGANPDDGSEAQAALAQTSGWVLSYSPEYRSLKGDPDYLSYIAGLTGGMLLTSPEGVFAHNLSHTPVPQPIWPWLLLAATLILPFDIAVRRLIITQSDWARLISLLGFGRRQEVPVQSGASRVGSLLSVKERVPRPRRPAAGAPEKPSTSATVDDQPGAPVPSRSVEPRSAPQPGSGRGTASSLLKSKRARQEEDHR
ncbi:MAG: VWA domain-containing protein [Anaerolineae bacterium]|nr:VWA domain-containing protein [Anaerolineae bacterium]